MPIPYGEQSDPLRLPSVRAMERIVEQTKITSQIAEQFAPERLNPLQAVIDDFNRPIRAVQIWQEALKRASYPEWMEAVERVLEPSRAMLAGLSRSASFAQPVLDQSVLDTIFDDKWHRELRDILSRVSLPDLQVDDPEPESQLISAKEYNATLYLLAALFVAGGMLEQLEHEQIIAYLAWLLFLIGAAREFVQQHRR